MSNYYVVEESKLKDIANNIRGGKTTPLYTVNEMPDAIKNVIVDPVKYVFDGKNAVTIANPQLIYIPYIYYDEAGKSPVQKASITLKDSSDRYYQLDRMNNESLFVFVRMFSGDSLTIKEIRDSSGTIVATAFIYNYTV